MMAASSRAKATKSKKPAAIESPLRSIAAIGSGPGRSPQTATAWWRRRFAQ